MNNANKQKPCSAHIMIHLNGNDGGGVKTVSEALHCAFYTGWRVSYLCDWDGYYARELQANGRELYICNLGKVKSQS